VPYRATDHRRDRATPATHLSSHEIFFHGAMKANMAMAMAKFTLKLELELELIQSHMAQKPVLRGEVGCACVAREVSVERGGMAERGCARRLGGWVWV